MNTSGREDMDQSIIHELEETRAAIQEVRQFLSRSRGHGENSLIFTGIFFHDLIFYNNYEADSLL